MACLRFGAKLHGSSEYASHALHLTWVSAWCMTRRARPALGCQPGLGRIQDLLKHHTLQAVYEAALWQCCPHTCLVFSPAHSNESPLVSEMCTADSSVDDGRYWTNPAVVEKISAAMGQPVAEGAQPEGEEAIEGGEEEEEEDEEPNVHSAASTGGPKS